jgi:hypothetical protein
VNPSTAADDPPPQQVADWRWEMTALLGDALAGVDPLERRAVWRALREDRLRVWPRFLVAAWAHTGRHDWVWAATAWQAEALASRLERDGWRLVRVIPLGELVDGALDRVWHRFST